MNRNVNHINTKTIYDPEGFYRNDFHKDTKSIYDPEGFYRNDFHKDTKTIYDPNGFDRNGFHKDTGKHYDPNDFNSYGFHKDTKTIYDPNGFDRNGYDIHDNRKKSSKIKTSKAKSFKDQKGKGHFNLPIALSKIYTNNNSKELISNIKQLINDLCDTKRNN